MCQWDKGIFGKFGKVVVMLSAGCMVILVLKLVKGIERGSLLRPKTVP